MFEKWVDFLDVLWYDWIIQNICSFVKGVCEMLIQENLTIEEKLRILSDAAKYDVSCTSSGVSRRGKEGCLGNAAAAGICHSFAADGRCISLLKILMTNQCIYDCKYCINRCTNDLVRTAFTPEEVCRLTIEFYRRNYIEGLFLSSGILYSADHTMERICQILFKLRNEHHFNGYIHVKAIPGASPELVAQAGFLADRMSVNLELPTAQGLRELAPGKTRDKILKPMCQIQQGIWASGQLLEERKRGTKASYLSGRAGFAGGAALLREEYAGYGEKTGADGPGRGGRREEVGFIKERGVTAGRALGSGEAVGNGREELSDGAGGMEQAGDKKAFWRAGMSAFQSKPFVPAGQSTQMIVGATPESDFQMLTVSQALYRSFGLKRVFYSAYIPINQDSSLPDLPGGPPLLREHRLYQADWLLRFYGFQAEELLSEDRPNFNVFLDPKCDWALNHLERFPVEVNRADYASLLRVPGIGVKSARRIMSARKGGGLDFPDLKKLGVVLKRAAYFITCSGKMMAGARLDQDYITSCLVGEERRAVWDIGRRDCYRQLSLFDDMKLTAPAREEDRRAAAGGDF